MSKRTPKFFTATTARNASGMHVLIAPSGNIARVAATSFEVVSDATRRGWKLVNNTSDAGRALLVKSGLAN